MKVRCGLMTAAAAAKQLGVSRKTYYRWEQRGLLVPGLRDEALEDLALVIDSLPQIAAFAVDLHEHLVEMPPTVAGPHALDAALPDLSREDRTKAEPPEPNRLVADVDAALVKKILDVPQRERTYIMTASRMISGLLWKYLKGSRFVMAGGYEAALPFSNGFLLTAPTKFF